MKLRGVLGSAFAEPIVPPKGEPLILRDAAKCIIDIPEEQKLTKAWQDAANGLLEAAEHDGPVLFARIAMVRFLFPNSDPTCSGSRKALNRPGRIEGPDDRVGSHHPRSVEAGRLRVVQMKIKGP